MWQGTVAVCGGGGGAFPGGDACMNMQKWLAWSWTNQAIPTAALLALSEPAASTKVWAWSHTMHSFVSSELLIGRDLRQRAQPHIAQLCAVEIRREIQWAGQCAVSSSDNPVLCNWASNTGPGFEFENG